MLDVSDSTPCGQATVQVTPLDANHCLGAVMFLFDGPFGRVLHCGDFRWERDYQEQCLHPVLISAAIDTIYLDNTYAHPRYDFPPRSQACHEVIKLVLSHPNHRIVLGVDSLGKEELLAAVAAAAGERVWVPTARFTALTLLGLPAQQLFTTDNSSARIIALSRHQVTLQQLAKLNRERPTIAILPSGYCTYAPTSTAAAAASASTVAAGKSVQSDAGHVHACSSTHPEASQTAGRVTAQEIEAASRLLFKVPYSLHSSFLELRSFVAALRPRQVIPTVSGLVDPALPTASCDLFADLLAPHHGHEADLPNKKRNRAPLAPALAAVTEGNHEVPLEGMPCRDNDCLDADVVMPQCMQHCHPCSAIDGTQMSSWQKLYAKTRTITKAGTAGKCT
ncbi:g10867 [Coccomyxa elongata]